MQGPLMKATDYDDDNDNDNDDDDNDATTTTTQTTQWRQRRRRQRPLIEELLSALMQNYARLQKMVKK